MRNKFDALQEKTETRTPNDEFENFINAHQEAAVKYQQSIELNLESHGRH